MIINANSWHGKMRSAFYNSVFEFPWFDTFDEHTQNGCLYLRDIFLWSWITIVGTAIIGAVLVGAPLFTIVDILTHMFGTVSLINGETTAAVLASIGYMAVGFASIIILIGNIGDMITSDFTKNKINAVKTSIVGTTVKSISEKICPIVEYK